MIVAMFQHENTLAQALRCLRNERIGPIETYTPAPLEGEATASSIPFVVLLAGVLGAAASFGVQSYSSIIAFPFPVGGRPQFAWPSFTPTIFENAMLVAIVAGFAAFMIVNGLPKLYDPVDEAPSMRQASQNSWILCLRNEDHATLARARVLLGELGPVSVEEVPP